MLRYQPEIGPGLDEPLVRYLTLPVVPTQLGFDPRLQLVARRRRDRRARGRRPQPGPRRRQRRPRRHDVADRALRLAAAARRSPIPPLCSAPLWPGRRAARRRRPLQRRHPPAALRARLRQHAGCARRSASSPRFDAEGAVRDFVAKDQGWSPGLPRRRRRRRRVGADVEAASGTATSGHAHGARGARRLPAPLRGGVEDGPRPAGGRRRAASALPKSVRDSLEPIARRIRRVPRGRVGPRRGVRRGRLPAFEFLYDVWWRVNTDGVRNVPSHGRGADRLQPRRLDVSLRRDDDRPWRS